MESRVLRPGDEALLIAAVLADEEEELSHERAVELLADDDWVGVVALDPEPVGLAFGHVLKMLKGESLLLYSIGVAEGHRRRGAAGAMVEALKRLCAERGLFEMWVLTNRSNGPAMRLYQSAGGLDDQPDVAMFEWATPGVERGWN